MQREELKAKIRWAGEEAWYKGNVDCFDDVYADDYIWYRPPFPPITGLAADKESVISMRMAMSDINIEYEEMVAEGDTIAYRWRMEMKHTGTTHTLQIPATNKFVILKGCTVVHVKDGKVVEEFEYSDYLGLLQQLGVIPAMA